MRTGLVLIIVGTLVATALLVWLVPRHYQAEFSSAVAVQPHDWAGSATCNTCHQDHHASWFKTFHRTMTQEADSQSVLGDFNGEVYRYWGIGVRPIKEDDRYYFEYVDDNDQPTVRLPILRTVGSHRYQQYLTQVPDGGNTYYRIHLVWHMEDQRWMHVNGIFLRPDDQGFDDRIAVWNHNCIFCHNTGPRPNITNMDEMRQRELMGEAVNSALEAQYDSTVAELGIACESCHGPGGEHAKRNRNPLRRLALQLTDQRDPTIVHPRKIDQQRSLSVCGQCHGQRTPLTRDGLMEWIDTGPTYRAGELLTNHVKPVFQDISVPSGVDPDIFRLRFWNDGTARLTAYEYQGVVQSACHDDPALTCISCHTMHSGDVRGNISEENRGNTPCLTCHTEFADDVSAHTKHAADSSGSLCYDCHMPKMIFGITDIHRSHRIEIPRPAQNVIDERPDACTNCHLDQSAGWAQAQVDRLWHDSPNRSTVDAPARTLESLHAGDPVQRAVAARLAGNDEKTPAADQAWLIPHLMTAMQDNYPSTRNLARKSLLKINERLQQAGLSSGIEAPALQFDFIGTATSRERLLAEMRLAWRNMDKTKLGTPKNGLLIDPDWETLQPQTKDLVDKGHSHKKQIAIGE
ncbi:MAG: hypothetical protein HKM98_02955 [Gammaproteobacteria bacterium]|nr:hypothetical protein [Gammaproteobacteria bacterium]